VIAQDLILVIFEDLDPEWLKSMCDEGGAVRGDMMEIVISLALLKLSDCYYDPFVRAI
jgi:hypothetical protein